MIRPPNEGIDVWLCVEPVDFRKQITGLAALVQDPLAMDPFSTQLFVFANRRRTQCRILYWERCGFVLWQKRLERARFAWPRRGDAAGRLGEWPFEIGLWVGKAGTPNHLGAKGDGRSDSARAKVSQYKNNPRGKPTPIPLESCPWCGEDFTPDSFALLPNSDKRPICASRARAGSASSPATVRYPSSRWTSPSTGASPRS